MNLNFQLSENVDTWLAIEIQMLHNDEIEPEWKQLVQHTLLLLTNCICGQMSSGERNGVAGLKLRGKLQVLWQNKKQVGWQPLGFGGAPGFSLSMGQE